MVSEVLTHYSTTDDAVEEIARVSMPGDERDECGLERWSL